MFTPLLHLEPVYRAVDKTIAKLAHARFRLDPILSAKRSQETSITSSALKRHGPILELALRHSLAAGGHYLVWEERAFVISSAADQLVTSQLEDACLVSRLPYGGAGEGARTLQLDIMAYDRRRLFLGAYEFKRGFGDHDAGKIRQIKRDLRATSVLLHSFGERRGLAISASAVKIILYYGSRSIGSPWALSAANLDAHFDWPVCRDLESATQYFRIKLDALLEHGDDPLPTDQLSLALGRP
jgi:hypothetical protein